MTKEEEKIQRMKNELLGLGPMLPGSISEQWNVCGTPGCQCKDPKRPVRHGPYFQLSFSVKGRCQPPGPDLERSRLSGTHDSRPGRDEGSVVSWHGWCDRPPDDTGGHARPVYPASRGVSGILSDLRPANANQWHRPSPSRTAPS